MASVTVFDSDRMLAIEQSAIVSGQVQGTNLHLMTKGGIDIDAGPVQGPTGATGVGPVGSISLFAGTVAPQGHLICNGAAVSRGQYPDLYNVIGTIYGAGDGVATFNLPNLLGRVAVGLDAGQTEFNTIGKTGGAKTHKLTIAEMPSHDHATGGSYGNNWPDGTGANRTALTTGTGIAYNDPRKTFPTGGDGSHNNLQPYMALNYIIKF